MENTVSTRTRLSYGLGCIGRDMSYTLVTTFIMTYLTLAVGLTNWQLAAIGVIMVVARVWDAINDPMMGTIIDNTRSKYGKFKPYIICGALLNSFCTILLFTDFHLSEKLFIVIFAITYILWGMTYTMNDISYWSMLPSLSTNPKEREKVSSLARIGANIGLFVATAAMPAITAVGKMNIVYPIAAKIIAVIFILCQILVVVGVQEHKSVITSVQSHTTLKDMLKIIFKNDQLLTIMSSILLFNIGYFVTTGFGTQFFYFDYGVYKGMEFTYFAICIGLAQIVALSLYPLLSKFMNRTQLFTLAISLVVLGYIGFMAVGYIIPMNMFILCCIGLILFSGQAIIQLLTLVLLADTIEYGQWKLGTRNESVIFSLNPFVTKLAGAIQIGIFSITMIISGLNVYSAKLSVLENDKSLTVQQVIEKGSEIVRTIPDSSTLIMRLSMIVLPLILILTSYFIYRKFYKIDSKMYDEILTDLKNRAEAVQ